MRNALDLHVLVLVVIVSGIAFASNILFRSQWATLVLFCLPQMLVVSSAIGKDKTLRASYLAVNEGLLVIAAMLVYLLSLNVHLPPR